MWLDYLLFALNSFKQYKLRSSLSMLGVAIGTFSIVAILTIGEGGKKLIISLITGGGTNLIVAHNDQMMETRVDKFDYLTESHLLKIKREIHGIDDVAFQYFLSTPMKVSGENRLLTVIGIPENWFKVRGLDIIAKGRKFTDGEVRTSQKVCLVGKDLFKSLFGEEENLNHELEIEGTYFKIIGLLGYKLKIGPIDPNNIIMVPSTSIQRLLGASEIYLMFIRVKDGISTSTVRERVDEYIRKIFSGRRTWDVRTMDEMIEILGNVTRVISIVITCIAAISLIVGGIGIMNMMLVAVRERTKEIGIRKAIGATDSDILWQFLIESIILCLIGGGIGVGGGVGIILLVTRMFHIDISLSIGPVILGFFFSCLVGIFFGVYPAYLAAKLKPVDALRYE
ncbi:MAG: ABC transporter permease [bacterium]